MKHTEILRSAAVMLADRKAQYGDHVECFHRASELSSITLNKSISTYDVAMILHCVKLARLQEARTKEDSYIDSVNYLAFAAEFSQQPGSVFVAVEDDAAAMAAKLAPVRNQVDG